MIKTVITGSGINKIKFDRFYRYFWIKNVGTIAITVSSLSTISENGDNAAKITPSDCCMIENYDNDSVYILGESTVEIHASDLPNCPFKISVKGGVSGDYLPLAGGMTTGTTGLANNFRAVAGNYTRLQLLLNGAWNTAIWGDNNNNGGIFGNPSWGMVKLNVDDPSHAYVMTYPIYSAGYKPFAAGSFGKSAEEITVECGFAPTFVMIFSSGGNPVIYSTETGEITISETGFTVNASVAENTYSYVAFR